MPSAARTSRTRSSRVTSSARVSISDLRERNVYGFERFVECIPRDDERRREPHHGLVRVFCQYAVRAQPVAYRTCGGFGRIDFESDQQAFAADLPHERQGRCLELRESILAHLR